MDNPGHYDEHPELTRADAKREKQETTMTSPDDRAALTDELASMTRMFHDACHALGLINEALDLDPDDAGADPILDAIENLKAERDQWVDAQHAAASQPQPVNRADGDAAGLTRYRINLDTGTDTPDECGGYFRDGDVLARMDDLRMLIQRLAHSLRKASPDNALSGQAMDYLKRVGMTGSIVRADGDDPVLWWNGFRKDDDERDGLSGPLFSPVETTWHDIPLCAGVNPCNRADGDAIHVIAFHTALVLEMSELCDRNSPEDEPDAMIANSDEMEGCIERALERTGLSLRADGDAVPVASALRVWYGSMPESNGKTNWTAILHRGDISKGHTIDRSEYPDRVRYEADRVRWLLGEIEKRPFILDYDADKRSDYASAPASTSADAPIGWEYYEEGKLFKTYDSAEKAAHAKKMFGGVVRPIFAANAQAPVALTNHERIELYELRDAVEQRMDTTPLNRIAHELRTYNPAADEHKGEHIHKVWAQEIEALLTAPAHGAQTPIAWIELCDLEDLRKCTSLTFGVRADLYPEQGDPAQNWAPLYAAPIASALPAQPVAHVPIHPVNGPLWANTVPSLDSGDRPKHYPTRALYFDAVAALPAAQPGEPTQ